ncbi:MAG: hypothetical protein HYZ83_03505 [Candidatus Omnitrophica bacterium]|nr:hypothetical protein [Candidatus Omnitrophota bacterium]
MSINHFRNSKLFRFLACFIILDLLVFQNLYGQEFQLQETNVYTPVKETGGDFDERRFPSSYSGTGFLG